MARRPDHPGPRPRRPPARLRRDGRPAAAASPADLEPLRAFLVRRRARELRRLAAALRGPRFAPSPTTGARRWSRSATSTARAGAVPPRPRWPCPRPGARSGGSSRTAPRSRRTRPRNPCTTCASAPRSCATCWSSSRRCTTRWRTAKVVKRPEGAAGLPRRVPGQRGAARTRSTRSLTRCWPSARLRPLRCWPWVKSRPGSTLSQAEARAEFAARFARFAGPAGRERVRVLLEGRR